MDNEPSNQDLLENLDSQDETALDFRTKQMQVNAETAKSLASLHQRLTEVPTKEETAKIVEEVITKLLLSKGKTLYTIILGVAALIIALVSILGGFATVLKWFGWGIIK